MSQKRHISKKRDSEKINQNRNNFPGFRSIADNISYDR